MSKKPVVILGASGYTGRLIAEYLREYQIPFIAAGRNKDRVKEAMQKVPGIETADYDIAQVDHTEEALTELLSGAQIVCNTVGPFFRFGEVAVQAALNAGVHYIDTTGEQSYMKAMRDKFGESFAKKNIVLAPSTAYMYATQEIAAHIVLEQEGIDSLDTALLAAGVPTYASTQTIFGMFVAENCHLEDSQLVPWPAAQGYEVNIPGRIRSFLGHPWGGGSLPLWFQHDSRVRNVQQLTAFTNRPMMEKVVEMQKQYEAEMKQLPYDEQVEALSKIADSIQGGMPPRENMLLHRTVDVAIGRGTSGSRTCIIRTGPGYLQTGAVQAAACHKLLTEGPEKVGFASPCQAFGYQYLLGQYKNFFPVEVEVL